ncbi:MAG: hypothetical protein ACYCZI_02740 [Metallibacterium scheffleri]
MSTLRDMAGWRGPVQQRGQAIAEMIIASAFLLVPLFLLMTLLMKYIDMDVAAQEAARYAAFQRTVYMPSSSLRGATAATRTQQEIETAMRVRLFGDPGFVNEQQSQNLNGFIVNPLWKDQGNRQMVAAQSASLNTLSDSASGLLQDDAAGAVFGTIHALGSLVGANIGFNLDYDGLMAAQVSLTPANPQGPIGYDNLATPSTLFEHLGLVFKAQDSVLADGWSAQGPDNNKQQIQSVMPLSGTLFTALNDIIKVADFGGTSGFGLFPDLSGLTFGYVPINSTDEVPADRLANYTPSGGINPPSGGSAQQATLTNLLKLYQTQLGQTCTQSNISGGAIQLSCVSGGTTTTVDVCPDGSQTAPVSSTTQDLPNAVETATTDEINKLTSQAPGSTAAPYAVSAGPTYYCVPQGGGAQGTCSPADLTNTKSTYYKGTIVKSVTDLTQTSTFGTAPNTFSSTSYGTLTVTLDAGGTSSTAVFGTSSSQGGTTCG